MTSFEILTQILSLNMLTNTSAYDGYIYISVLFLELYMSLNNSQIFFINFYSFIKTKIK